MLELWYISTIKVFWRLSQWKSTSTTAPFEITNLMPSVWRTSYAKSLA